MVYEITSQRVKLSNEENPLKPIACLYSIHERAIIYAAKSYSKLPDVYVDATLS